VSWLTPGRNYRVAGDMRRIMTKSRQGCSCLLAFLPRGRKIFVWGETFGFSFLDQSRF
jgi:hypothetical protein